MTVPVATITQFKIKAINPKKMNICTAQRLIKVGMSVWRESQRLSDEGKDSDGMELPGYDEKGERERLVRWEGSWGKFRTFLGYHDFHLAFTGEGITNMRLTGRMWNDKSLKIRLLSQGKKGGVEVSFRGSAYFGQKLKRFDGPNGSTLWKTNAPPQATARALAKRWGVNILGMRKDEITRWTLHWLQWFQKDAAQAVEEKTIDVAKNLFRMK